MKLLLVVLVVLAELAGTAILISWSPWLAIAGVLALIVTGMTLARLVHGPRKPPVAGGYVERQSEFY